METMEIRKVQLTGKTSYTVSLPKAWATQVGLKQKSRVGISTLPDGSLRVSPGEITKPQAHGVFDIQDLFEDALARQMISIYVAGYETFELRATKIHLDQRKTIRDMTYRLIGMEVIEENAASVVIQDFLSPDELKVKKSIRRMHLIAESMHVDATKSLLKNDTGLAKDVMLRDRDVDRHYLLVLKRLQAMVNMPLSEASDITANQRQEYYLTTISLQRIAHQATRRAQCMLALAGRYVPPEILGNINEASESSNEIIKLAVDALFKLDLKLAEKAIGTKSKQTSVLKRIETMALDLDVHVALLLHCISNSIERVADYGVGIAEAARNLAVATSNAR